MYIATPHKGFHPLLQQMWECCESEISVVIDLGQAVEADWFLSVNRFEDAVETSGSKSEACGCCDVEGLEEVHVDFGREGQEVRSGRGLGSGRICQ